MYRLYTMHVQCIKALHSCSSNKFVCELVQLNFFITALWRDIVAQEITRLCFIVYHSPEPGSRVHSTCFIAGWQPDDVHRLAISRTLLL